MKHWWKSSIILLSCLGASGCVELIRRSPAPESAAADWSTPGNQSVQTDVQNNEPASPPARAETAVPPDSLAPAAENQVARIYRPERGQQQHQKTREVNEYALWCIENGLWSEARLHLEQGLQRDSLAASLHNNLGIVYERLGQEKKAREAYEKARGLSPGKKAYRVNFQLFEQRQRTDRTDSLGVQTEAPEGAPDAPPDSSEETHPPGHKGE